MDGGLTKRLFVAVPLPPNLVAFVKRAQESLEGMEGVRLLDSDRLHCTLAFIGEADHREEAAARRVVAGLDGGCGGEAVIDGIMYLPSSRRARVVALRVDDEGGILGGLFKAVRAGLETHGVIGLEERPFRPHVTMARIQRPRRLQPTADCGRARFGVESVCLYASELRPTGAVHHELERKQLQKA